MTQEDLIRFEYMTDKEIAEHNQAIMQDVHGKWQPSRMGQDAKTIREEGGEIPWSKPQTKEELEQATPFNALDKFERQKQYNGMQGVSCILDSKARGFDKLEGEMEAFKNAYVSIGQLKKMEKSLRKNPEVPLGYDIRDSINSYYTIYVREKIPVPVLDENKQPKIGENGRPIMTDITTDKQRPVLEKCNLIHVACIENLDMSKLNKLNVELLRERQDKNREMPTEQILNRCKNQLNYSRIGNVFKTQIEAYEMARAMGTDYTPPNQRSMEQGQKQTRESIEDFQKRTMGAPMTKQEQAQQIAYEAYMKRQQEQAQQTQEQPKSRAPRRNQNKGAER